MQPFESQCHLTGLSTTDQKLEVVFTYDAPDGQPRALTLPFRGAANRRGGVSAVKKGKLVDRTYEALMASKRVEIGEDAPTSSLETYKERSDEPDTVHGLEWLTSLIVVQQREGKRCLLVDGKPITMLIGVQQMFDAAVKTVEAAGTATPDEGEIPDLLLARLGEAGPVLESLSGAPKSMANQLKKGSARLLALETFCQEQEIAFAPPPAAFVSTDEQRSAVDLAASAMARLGHFSAFKSAIGRLFPALKPKKARKKDGSEVTLSVVEVRERIADCPTPVQYVVGTHLNVDEVVNHKKFGKGVVTAVVGAKAQIAFLDDSGKVVPKTLLCAG